MWFLEPSTIDNTYAYRGEHPMDWIARSTILRAQECRRFLNEHVAKLPQQWQSKIVHDLHEKWHSTFFEIIVARTLQELGASISLEDANIDGKHPDFTAQFSSTTITVEAKAPIFNGEASEDAKDHRPLLELIEANLPMGWRVGVWQLPKIGPSESKREFKRIIKEILDIPASTEKDEPIDIVREISSGIIHLHLYPFANTMKQLAYHPPIAFFDDSVLRIRYAVEKKRRQVRNSGFPVLLAIQASGICSSFEDYDRALFGNTYGSYDKNYQLVDVGFLEDGIFNTKREGQPVFAGVLAFLSVGFMKSVEPVLYLHPRFTGVLPRELLLLAQRRYDSKMKTIQHQTSQIPNLFEQFNFVNT